MSTVTQHYNDGNQAHFGYDTAKIFIFDNEYREDSFENDTGGDLELVAGTVLGRETASGNLKVLKSGASDGSQFPVGVLANDIAIADTVTDDVVICISGKIAEGKIVLDGTDTLDTMISGRPIKDRIACDTAGIILVPTRELSAQDNT